jgi:hypothetical protein
VGNEFSYILVYTFGVSPILNSFTSTIGTYKTLPLVWGTSCDFSVFKSLLDRPGTDGSHL